LATVETVFTLVGVLLGVLADFPAFFRTDVLAGVFLAMAVTAISEDQYVSSYSRLQQEMMV
jgi:hypothetical protein